jgi:hypothetical protein
MQRFGGRMRGEKVTLKALRRCEDNIVTILWSGYGGILDW